MSWHTDVLIARFAPIHGGPGCSATIRDIPRCYGSTTKRELVYAIAAHANWLQSSEGSGNKAARREASIRTHVVPDDRVWYAQLARQRSGGLV